jgi:hypothetical protein
VELGPTTLGSAWPDIEGWPCAHPAAGARSARPAAEAVGRRVALTARRTQVTRRSVGDRPLSGDSRGPKPDIYRQPYRCGRALPCRESQLKIRKRSAYRLVHQWVGHAFWQGPTSAHPGQDSLA